MFVAGYFSFFSFFFCIGLLLTIIVCTYNIYVIIYNKYVQPYKYVHIFFVYRYLIAFKNLLRSIESLGIASVYGINYFGRGILVGDNYVSYVRHEALGRDLLNGSLTYVPSLKHFYIELTRTMSDYGRIKSRYVQHTHTSARARAYLYIFKSDIQYVCVCVYIYNYYYYLSSCLITICIHFIYIFIHTHTERDNKYIIILL